MELELEVLLELQSEVLLEVLLEVLMELVLQLVVLMEFEVLEMERCKIKKCHQRFWENRAINCLHC